MGDWSTEPVRTVFISLIQVCGQLCLLVIGIVGRPPSANDISFIFGYGNKRRSGHPFYGLSLLYPSIQEQTLVAFVVLYTGVGSLLVDRGSCP